MGWLIYLSFYLVGGLAAGTLVGNVSRGGWLERCDISLYISDVSLIRVRAMDWNPWEMRYIQLM